MAGPRGAYCVLDRGELKLTRAGGRSLLTEWRDFVRALRAADRDGVLAGRSRSSGSMDAGPDSPLNALLRESGSCRARGLVAYAGRG